MNFESAKDKLIRLYGEKMGDQAFLHLEGLVKDAKAEIKSESHDRWAENDLILITYADSFFEEGKPALPTLQSFADKYLKNKILNIHILPFFPDSSDRGFSVIDYYKVKEGFGKWNDVTEIGKNFRLMADVVGNHVSAESEWFKKFLKGDKKYRDYFISYDKDTKPSEDDLKKIRRGRTTSVLSSFDTDMGERFLWTTYSRDQIDLNYRNPEVLLEVVKVFLFYLKQGIRIFRFDGAGSLWKELGTSCKHLPNNHIILSIIRRVLEEVCPSSILFTETTTASFEENKSYLNNEEANVVYNFALAPLLLSAFYEEDATELSELATLLKPESDANTFFNILDIHDGINIYAANSMLSEEKRNKLFDEVKRRGGVFSYRNLPDGGTGVKEMHITWWSALNNGGAEGFETELKKFLTSRAIAMSLKGIPGIYYLSLFGAVSDTEAFKKSNHGRDMNRTRLPVPWLNKQLSDTNSREYKIFTALIDLIEKRKSTSAFHPDSPQEVINLDKRLFAVIRGAGPQKVLAVHNISGQKVDVKYNNETVSLLPYSFEWKEIKE